VGVWPAASITGFPPGTSSRLGIPALGDVMRNRPDHDTTAAYLNLAGLVSAPILPALGGRSHAGRL